MSYVVVRVGENSPHPPRVSHVSMDDAFVEAERLSAKHPGVCFLACEILAAYQTSPVPHKIDLANIPLKAKPAIINEAAFHLPA